MATVSGLRTHGGILDFEFSPSLSIMAKDVLKMGLAIRSFKEPLKRAVQQVMIPSIKANFAAGGRPPWDDLADGTLTNKEFYGFGDNILIRTGALQKGATQVNIWTINENSATVRDLPQSIWYGKVHQAGYDGGGSVETMASTGRSLAEAIANLRANAGSGSGGAPSIPARPFIMFQPGDQEKIEAIFARWLDERILATWSRTGLGLGAVL